MDRNNKKGMTLGDLMGEELVHRLLVQTGATAVQEQFENAKTEARARWKERVAAIRTGRRKAEEVSAADYAASRVKIGSSLHGNMVTAEPTEHFSEGQEVKLILSGVQTTAVVTDQKGCLVSAKLADDSLVVFNVNTRVVIRWS